MLNLPFILVVEEPVLALECRLAIERNKKVLGLHCKFLANMSKALKFLGGCVLRCYS